MIAATQDWKVPARANHIEQLALNGHGEAATKASQEFGLDYPDAYLLALKDNQGKHLDANEQATLDGYRFFKDKGLEPMKVKTAVYFFAKLRAGEALDSNQANLYRTYCQQARVIDPGTTRTEAQILNTPVT